MRPVFRLHDIMAAVCDSTGFELDDLFDESQAQALVQARCAVVWIAREKCRGLYSYPKIAQHLGRTRESRGSHATAMTRYRWAVRNLDDPEFRRLVARALVRLRCP